MVGPASYRWAFGIYWRQGITGLYMGFLAYFASRTALQRYFIERSFKEEFKNVE
jgi:hypothetical protein